MSCHPLYQKLKKSQTVVRVRMVNLKMQLPICLILVSSSSKVTVSKVFLLLIFCLQHSHLV